jgi:exopolysaccharide production protein ExoQ
MAPSLALLLWLILLLGLLRFDPARDRGVSLALWIPLTWMFIVASRLPSQWVGTRRDSFSAALEEGNPLDRVIYTMLIVFGIWILLARSFNWGFFFKRNPALALCLLFALLSVVWSDFPFIAFKRWFRDLGNYLMIVVVLSDPVPSQAVSTLLRRLCYLLIPLSIVLIRYFPTLGVQYNVWTGAQEYIGATTSKNMLGVACLVSGLFLFWDILTRWSSRKARHTKLILLLDVTFLAMTCYLLNLSSSATSRACLILGCLLMTAAHTKAMRRQPRLLTVLVPISICLYSLLAFGFGIDINSLVTGALGRNSTFTGRTVIWNAVLSTHTNPLVGTGYDTFWLGPRLRQVWSQTGLGINEAHDGYLETYLNLGLLGVLFLAGFLVSSYRTVRKTIETFSGLTCLPFALWTIVLFYNVTEAAFKGQLIWVTFLLGAIVVPAPSRHRITGAQRPSVEESSSAAVEAQMLGDSPVGA